jgi:hypothetical protein
MSSYKKNLEYPPKSYGHFVRRVALDYFKKHSLESLKQKFLNHEEDGLMSFQIDLLYEFIEALASSELYNDYDRDYQKHRR